MIEKPFLKKDTSFSVPNFPVDIGSRWRTSLPYWIPRLLWHDAFEFAGTNNSKLKFYIQLFFLIISSIFKNNTYKDG